MPTQKLFKRRVRTRMAKTGESYTTARLQLLRKATEPDAAATPGAPTTPTPEPEVVDRAVMNVPDASMVERTGRSHAEWFALLDAWGAADRTHPEIARWLGAEHRVPGWWTQSITVSYERARGRRARHQMTAGFEVTVNRTVDVPVETALAAFTDDAIRERWLPGVTMRRRPSRAAATARFDWPEPASRIAVTVAAKGAERATVSVVHERLPDADAAAAQKTAWRDRLAALKSMLGRGPG